MSAYATPPVRRCGVFHRGSAAKARKIFASRIARRARRGRGEARADTSATPFEEAAPFGSAGKQEGAASSPLTFRAVFSAIVHHSKSSIIL